MIDVEKKLISKSQLLEFARVVYSDACYGHLDLADNYCEKAVDGIFRSLASRLDGDKPLDKGVVSEGMWGEMSCIIMPPQQQQNLFITRQILTDDVTITNDTITIS